MSTHLHGRLTSRLVKWRRMHSEQLAGWYVPGTSRRRSSLRDFPQSQQVSQEFKRVPYLHRKRRASESFFVHFFSLASPSLASQLVDTKQINPHHMTPSYTSETPAGS